MPQVSICIPTYNGSRYLPQAIASARAQTFEDVEILVVDDGSSDDTYQMACDLLAGDARGRVERNAQNLGLVGNWNRCVELAQGEYVKFLFQDDLLEPDCVARLVEAIGLTEGFAFSERRFLIEDDVAPIFRKFYGEDILTMRRFQSEAGPIAPTEFASIAVRTEIAQNIVGEPTCVLFRKSHFQSLGPFTPYLAQLCDWEYWMRIGLNFGCCYVPQELSTFRVHGASESSTNLDKARAVASGDMVALLGLLKADSNFAPIWSHPRMKTLYGRLWNHHMIALQHVDPKDYHPTFIKFLRDHPPISRAVERGIRGKTAAKFRILAWRALDRMAIIAGKNR